jgi:hypothetical protein
MSEIRETVWLTVKEYAATRKLSESTVRRLLKDGTLTADHVSHRCLRIRLTRVVRSSQEASQPPRA